MSTYELGNQSLNKIKKIKNSIPVKKELKQPKNVGMTSAEVKRVLCADPAADGSAGLFESHIFHSTSIVIRTYFSSSLDSPLWNASQKSTGGSNKMNFFKLPIVAVPHWWIEPICIRNAVTGNPHYYHSKRAKKGPNDVLLIPVQRADRHSVLRSLNAKWGGSIFTMDLQSYHLLLEPHLITAADYSIH